MVSNEAASRRLFFALWPDEAMRQRLHRATRKSVRNSGGRPISPENFHITLAFLGNVESQRLGCIREVASAVRGRALQLKLDEPGYFARPRLLWLGMSFVPPDLLDLAQALKMALKRCGFAPERRAYRPHVTLARKVSTPNGLDEIFAIEWRANSFALVESIRTANGARYQVLKSWPLTAPEEASGY